MFYDLLGSQTTSVCLSWFASFRTCYRAEIFVFPRRCGSSRGKSRCRSAGRWSKGGSMSYGNWRSSWGRTGREGRGRSSKRCRACMKRASSFWVRATGVPKKMWAMAVRWGSAGWNVAMFFKWTSFSIIVSGAWSCGCCSAGGGEPCQSRGAVPGSSEGAQIP